MSAGRRYSRAPVTHPGQAEFVIRDVGAITMDPHLGNPARTDLHVRDGAIVNIGRGLPATSAIEIDGAGLTALPGLVADHRHPLSELLGVADPHGAGLQRRGAGRHLPRAAPGAARPDIRGLHQPACLRRGSRRGPRRNRGSRADRFRRARPLQLSRRGNRARSEEGRPGIARDLVHRAGGASARARPHRRRARSRAIARAASVAAGGSETTPMRPARWPRAPSARRGGSGLTNGSDRCRPANAPT